MFSSTRRRLKEPFGKAGLTVAICALVLALAGGAYAAGGLTKSQEKQVTKIAKKYAGKPGAPGAAGTNGTNGTNGKDGAAGASGKDGTSVTVTESANAIEGHCTGTGTTGKGGSKFQVGATAAYACNGKEGKAGTFGGESLPSGKTLTGTYAASGFGENEFPEPGFGEAATGVTFALPVSGALVPHYVSPKLSEEIQQGVPGAELPAGCTGTQFEPGAEAGNLCVFGEGEVNVFGALSLTPNGNPYVGFDVAAFSATKGYILVAGTWAATAQ